MTHYCKTSKSKPENVLAEAIKFFSSDGVGLQLREKSKDNDGYCASLKSEGRHIFIKICERENNSEIEVESCDCDLHVNHFLEKI